MSTDILLYVRRGFRLLALASWVYVATGNHSTPAWLRVVALVAIALLGLSAMVNGIDLPLFGRSED